MRQYFYGTSDRFVPASSMAALTDLHTMILNVVLANDIWCTKKIIGWKTILSFWGKRLIFRGEPFVLGRVYLLSNARRWWMRSRSSLCWESQPWQEPKRSETQLMKEIRMVRIQRCYKTPQVTINNEATSKKRLKQATWGAGVSAILWRTTKQQISVIG